MVTLITTDGNLSDVTKSQRALTSFLQSGPCAASAISRLIRSPSTNQDSASTVASKSMA
jgi:hypothetical protein